LNHIHLLLRFLAHPTNAPYKNFLDNITSSNPFQDINLVQWVIFGFALFSIESWVTLLWSCSLNLLVVSVFRFIIGAKRPFEVDTRLRALANRGRQVSERAKWLQTDSQKLIYPTQFAELRVSEYGDAYEHCAEWVHCVELFRD